MNNKDSSQEAKKILELIYLEDKKIRLRLAKSSEAGPITFYEENEIDMERIDSSVKEINHYLSLVNSLKNPDHQLFTQLQKTCQLLYEELLSMEIKLSLQKTPYKNLELILDDQLIHIPWELLFDGEKFLCERFSIGRQIRTKGKQVSLHPNSIQTRSQLRMLIIADPTEDLEVAFKEGCLIFDEFKQKEAQVKVTFQSSEILTWDFVKKNLRDFDIVHYAGHVEYNPTHPHESGWILSDGKFSSTDILKMINGTVLMPSLVFCNACKSGSTDKWAPKRAVTDSVYPSEGLIHAFIMAGVKYYIGTFSEVSDEYGAYMGIEFYHHLLHRNTIGESLRKARESFRKKFGSESFSWINYMLYGDPGYYLISTEPKNYDKKKFDNGSSKIADKYPKTPSSINHSYGKRSKPITFATRGKFIVPWWHKWMGRLFIFLLFLTILSFLIFSKQKKWNPRFNKQELIQDKEKRIEALKNTIYKKLKEREAKRKSAGKPDIHFDRWTSRPLTIAIFDIFDYSEPLPDWATPKINYLYKKLTQYLVKDSRIRVIERKELDNLLKEKDLVISDLPLDSKEDRKLFGGFLYARVMLFLEGYQFPDNDIYLCYKLVDVETGEIFNIDPDKRLQKKGIPLDLTDIIYSQMKVEISNKYPLRGRIVSIQNDAAILNIGADTGVKEGDIFEVLDSNAKKGKKSRIGRIKVMCDAVDPTRSQCEILEDNGLSNGLRVEAVRSDLE